MTSRAPAGAARRLRIVHVTPSPYPSVGGSELYVQEISERLAARGHEVYVFARADRPGAVRSPAEGPRVLRFVPKPRLSDGLDRLARMPGGYRLQRLVFSDAFREHLGQLWPGAMAAALRLRPDIVTTVNWAARAVAWQFLPIRSVGRFRLVGLPLLHTEDSHWNAWTRGTDLSALVAGYDALLALTGHEADILRRRGGLAAKIGVVGAGVDPLPFERGDGEAFRRRHGLGSSPLVGFVGRMHPGKGVIRLIEAMRIVWRSFEDARLLLAGARFTPSRREEQEFGAVFDGLGPEDRARIVHLGAFEERDKPDLYDAMDVFAMPSVVDSFGIVFLEAWLRRKPVVGGRTPALSQVIAEGQDGLLADPHTPQEIADSIVALLKDPEMGRRLGEAGRAKVLERFTWDRVTDRIEAFYQQAVP